MPRLKSWIDRIPLILQRLATDTRAVYARVEVEELFDIGRSQAVDLMRIAGASVRNGAESTVSRENLRYYVERCPEAQAWQDEIDHQEKVQQAIRDGKAAIRHGTVGPLDQYTRFRDLVDVSIADGRLTILFADPADLVRKLYQLAQAEANEPAEFERLCAKSKAAT